MWTWVHTFGHLCMFNMYVNYSILIFYWSVLYKMVWCLHCFSLLSHSSLLAFCLFFDFANFSFLSLSVTLSHTLFLSNLYFLCLCSLFAPSTAWTPHHSLRFSVVPPGGCSFVPPSSSPFWSGTGTAFLLYLSLPCCIPTFPGFQRQMSCVPVSIK